MSRLAPAGGALARKRTPRVASHFRQQCGPATPGRSCARRTISIHAADPIAVRAVRQQLPAMTVDVGSLVEDDSARRQELLATARKELIERQFSNSESYDKAILTLSSAFLALSLTFIKDVLGAGPVRDVWTLYASWMVFAAAIICTVASFRVSDAALNVQVDLIERYYQGRDEAAAGRSS